jgi:hypothetical protein
LFPQCRLQKPGPQPLPDSTHRSAGLADPLGIGFGQSIGRLADGKLIEPAKMRYAFSADRAVSDPCLLGSRRILMSVFCSASVQAHVATSPSRRLQRRQRPPCRTSLHVGGNGGWGWGQQDLAMRLRQAGFADGVAAWRRVIHQRLRDTSLQSAQVPQTDVFGRPPLR